MSVFHVSPQEEGIQPFQKCQGNDERFLALAQESADVFWLLTPQGEMEEISSRWQAFTGQEQERCAGRGWLEALYPVEQLHMEEVVRQVVRTGQTTSMECHIRRSDGAYHLVRVRMIPVQTSKKAVQELILCGDEIVRQEPSEQISNVQVEMALGVSGVGIWDWDITSNRTVWPDQTKALFGLAATTPMTYQRFLDAVHPDDRGLIEQLTASAQTEQLQSSCNRYASAPADRPKNYRVVWPDGSIHWLEHRMQVMYDAQGKPIHMVGATIDITEMKQAEEALRQSQAEWRMLTDIMPQIVWIAGPDGCHEYGNQRFYTYANVSHAELCGNQWVRMFHPDDREGALTRWRAVLQTGQAYETEVRLCDGKTGEYHWFLTRAAPLLDEQGRILKWFGTCTNIDMQKQAEEALRESERRFRSLVDSNIIGIVVSDLQGVIREANDAFLASVGYTREDLVAGRIHWPDLTAPEYLACSMQAMSEVLATGVAQSFEKEHITKDGRRVPVLIGITRLGMENTSLYDLVFILDLTERKELERQKDLMLGMTSHELKTPLAALKGTFQLVERRVQRLRSRQDDLSTEARTFLDDLLERLGGCVRQVDMQTHLINDLLDVSRITAHTLQLELGTWNLAAIVRETVESLRLIAPERTLLLDVPEDTVVVVRMDRDRISQVVANYVTNALRYGNPHEPVQIGLTLREGVARVWVRDKGPGLSEEERSKLWQRFYQVKGVAVQSGSGKGLGLGLYICQTLIAQHQGKVGVESVLGEGSTFWFTLPLITSEFSQEVKHGLNVDPQHT